MNGGRIPRNVTAICETFKISCLMGRHHMGGGSENHSTDQLYRLEQMAQYHPIFCDIETRSVWFKSLVRYVRRFLYAEGIWQGDIMTADIEEVEQMDASELHARRLNAKEVFTPMKGDNYIFPVADGTVEVSGGDRRLRTSTLIRDRPDRGEEQDILRGESERQDSQETSFTINTWNPESNFSCRLKDHSLFH